MPHHTISTPTRVWSDSPHASLCLLGTYLRHGGFFTPLETHVQIQQKAIKYTPIQKLEMLLVSLLAGAKAVSHTGLTLRVDPVLAMAFGLPGCAEQSVIAATLAAATEADVLALRVALAEIFCCYGQARRHDFVRGLLVLDVDLSPLPASAQAEGSERGYMGRCRSKTGRKLVRVRAASSQETIWEEVIPGRTAESLPVLQTAIQAAEQLLGLAGDDPVTQARRARTEIRLDSGWGSEAMITWLLARGYQVTGKFKSNSRVRKLVRGITTWQATSSPGREVATVPEPVSFVRPLAQYAVRTPSKEKAGGYYHAVVFTSCLERSRQEVVERYDKRAGMEADLKSDKHGLALALIRKRRLAAQKRVVLLIGLAHNLLLWARGWLVKAAPRLSRCGIVRLVQEVWTVPGRIKVNQDQIVRVRLQRDHPRARDTCSGLCSLLAASHILVGLE
jgi:hypothetical protein